VGKRERGAGQAEARGLEVWKAGGRLVHTNEYFKAVSWLRKVTLIGMWTLNFLAERQGHHEYFQLSNC
jgi:hypothetical protein